MTLDLARLLNPEQYEAATTTEGPLLILAGAGSGKTRVLVHRIAHIVEKRRAWPREILAVTFTNKAAAEMRHRAEALIGPSAKEAWIGTFHSLCGRMLRREGHRLGYDASFTIYDDDDQKRVIRRVMQELQIETDGRGVSINQVAHEIDRAKNHGQLPATYLKRDGGGFRTPSQSATLRVYPRYQDELRRSNAMDFGDLLLLTKEILEHHPEARENLAHRFRYLLVDEFQDTNKVQYEILKLLLLGHDNLAVVGDDDQSIYRWRGAEVGNILGFTDDFPNAKVVRLEQNYRSTGHILSAANAVIQRNKRRHKKTLFTEAEAGLPIGVAMLDHGDEEAFLVAETIAARIRGGADPHDFVILYRQNAQSRAFEEALRRARVPFVIIGGTGFYERREIRDLLAYLRLLVNPRSMEDLERIINVPPRKIGETTVDRLRAAGAVADVTGLAILDLPDETLEAQGLKGKTLERIRELGALMKKLGAQAEEASASDVARALIEAIDYPGYLEAADPASAEDRIANVQELVTSIVEHETARSAAVEGGYGIAGARTPLAAFLDETSLVSTADRDSLEGSVSMMTLHAAKGLEFPVVFMVGMEEHTFPIRRAVEGLEDDLEEERRLCYVGMTRAMRELNLLCARYRRIYGNEEVRLPSRFLGELPDAIVTTFGRRTRPAFADRSASDDAGAEARVEYEEIDPHDPDDAPYVPPAPRPRVAPPPGGGGGMRVGARVIHNLFGVGVVEAVSGSGANAHLTIRFPTEGTKRVVARFVRPAEDS